MQTPPSRHEGEPFTKLSSMQCLFISSIAAKAPSGFGLAGSIDSGALARALWVQPGDFFTGHCKLVFHNRMVSPKNGEQSEGNNPRILLGESPASFAHVELRTDHR